MLNLSGFDLEKYQNQYPFPFFSTRDVLDNQLAIDLRKEILELSDDQFDRYENPFESKWTLRDKNNLPSKCQSLFNYLTSDHFLKLLSNLMNIKLISDPTKNFWGIHKFKNNDKLDIHVDAGIHPTTKLKKEITLGIYLSDNWEKEFGGELELWKGENSIDNKAKIERCVEKISPLFNTLVIFSCTDDSWHGVPKSVSSPSSATRIFLTISYLSDRPSNEFQNKRPKAFFVPLPDEKPDPEKDRLRLLRADIEKYKEMYRYKM